MNDKVSICLAIFIELRTGLLSLEFPVRSKYAIT